MFLRTGKPSGPDLKSVMERIAYEHAKRVVEEGIRDFRVLQ
jgi:hypothetical protein